MTSVMFSPGNAEGKAMKNYGKLIVGGFAIMAAYSAFPVHAARGAEPKPATAATQAYLEQFSASLPFADREDFELATRGFVAAVPGNRILDAEGNLLRDLNVDGFFSQPAPPTVNPSLWRNAGLVAKSGLFKVSDRVYQVRGVDAANMTIVLGDTGFIVIDSLWIAEAARASIDLAREKLGNRPIMGVVYTHTHVDHYGGIKGILDEQEARARHVPILAPRGFMDQIASENVTALPAWARRAAYQFGFGLPLDAKGFVTTGDGPLYSGSDNTVSVAGTTSLIPPTHEITHTGEAITIDGVRMEFQLTPGTEAPTEMNIFLPDLHTLCLAENAGGTLHNLLPLRGAEVRDAKAWADYLTESLRLYGSRTEYLVTQHYWPRWGHDNIVDYVSSQRDAYKYLHDQTVRMMNNGLTGSEIAERIKLPDVLARRWFNRGNYGTMSHNTKAIYQRYLGWYDGNPAHLNPLPPEEANKRYVDAMGGEDAVLKKSKDAFDQGDYRWSSELLSRLVFAAPSNEAARLLLADSLEQMGYQSESGSWRNAYLNGAKELRTGGPGPGIFDADGNSFRNLPVSYILDLLSVRLNPDKALKVPMKFDLDLVGEDKPQSIEIRNGVLIHENAPAEKGNTRVVTVDRNSFIDAVQGRHVNGGLSGDDATFLERFGSLFEAPRTGFPLAAPGSR
ncbi:MAG TPA: alkyl sulfatase dimerization domain-containing protein [Candidatus Bathyarchaeia archaeon]|nr:alkyl sulfatase dimerization domain-containing protein [Candidatus Bathyarchaeia archaeon]